MTEIYKNTAPSPTDTQINSQTDNIIKKPENEEIGSRENVPEIKEIKFFISLLSFWRLNFIII